MEKLTEKKCVPCEGGVQPFTAAQIKDYLAQLKTEWEVVVQTLNGSSDPERVDGKSIRRQFKFKDFKEALAFIDKVGEAAEQEGHHPDMRLYGYNKVEIELSTHAIGGLSENDFILAAKIEEV